jgi:hypothetical protein
MFRFLRGAKRTAGPAERSFAAIEPAARHAAAAPAVPAAAPALSGGDLHVPRATLSHNNLMMHYAISSLREELEAVDWYRQRADDCDDEELKAILLHNAKEEIEHACLALEWIRRNDPLFDKELREYLFSEGPIVALEKRVMGR